MIGWREMAEKPITETATGDEIEVTPGMIEAGVTELALCESGDRLVVYG
jgi:hypothetical protein